MKSLVFTKNRENLLKKLEDNSLLVLFAGEAKRKTADEYFPFTPNRNFYYLTGVDEEKHILMIKKINGVVDEVLYILKPNLEQERWTGKTIRDYEAKEVSGIENIKYLEEFKSDLNMIFTNGIAENLYLDLERVSFDEEMSKSQSFAKEVKDRYPQVVIKDVYSYIASLRQIKCKEEVEEIKKAAHITAKGVELLMKECKPGMKEYELEAYFDFYLKQNGVKDYAFKTIAATGVNAATLHYVDNNSEIKDGDLILFDLGAQVNYYNGDISRTFPANGKFTKRQKEVYEEVLKVNEEIINSIRPGVGFYEINDKANNLLAEACVRLGLIEDKKDYRKYYFHSIGHSLGLDTHDVGKRDIILEEGMVYTVEPGLYIEEEAIGIRIEDDVLVTKDGCEVLTKECIKSVEDIEKFMSNR
ncbi:aminopeptidase P family protein [Clostridium perfringens]|uniref:aminopeptidase P family protein n=1 Tax=Clostridium perfringens TaxID=1502 RepID=UPI00145993FF|nr:aminopeptidase P family protein [Clostridium perfringens]MDK0813074.1 aminopeptidase P family protein [Clostridium perfringens]MDK0855434.1 aminopeptidase P family protein [Clostridium perfringens]MDK0908418.1 aminopeptidase P family protein [Clostridium perfringens]MDZ5040621.1 M24 family metallopeptidase [Clostridium perfringens]NMF20583.1 aminopeptidase P family protein [Clostridium perfringens]